MPARGRSHNQRDLGDDAGHADVAVEDLAVEAEGDDAFLDTGAGALVDADEGTSGLEGEVHDLDDLLAVDLAEAAAEDGGVLGEHAHVAAVDGAVAGDDAVAEGAVVGEAEVDGAVAGEGVEFDERALVEERGDAFAGGELALGVHLLHSRLAHGLLGLGLAGGELGQLSGSGVDVGCGSPRLFSSH